MRVNKTVTTQYEVELPHDITPLNLAGAIRKLEDEGVYLANAKIEVVYNRTFIVTNTVKTYYDSSTLHKMEK